MIIDPKEIPTKSLHAYMLGAIAPRPICFASTVDAMGHPNLSPFSFFNAFGSHPPIIVFSPARRVRNNTLKHTLNNIEATGEVVVAVVNYDMVQQVSLASCEYPESVNEFIKSGFTPKKADLIKPFLVSESPVNMECKLIEIKHMGTSGGAANLIICEIIRMHIKDEILDDTQMIDPHRIDLVARMGKDYYCRASGQAVFEVPKPNTQLGIGFDQLPDAIRNSNILSGNDLGKLANVSEIPNLMNAQIKDNRLKEIISENEANIDSLTFEVHHYAKELLEQNKIEEAWQVLLSFY